MRNEERGRVQGRRGKESDEGWEEAFSFSFFFFPILLFFPIQPNQTILRQNHRLGRGKTLKKRSVRDERKDRKLRMANIMEGQNQLSRIEPEEGGS